MFGNDYHTPCTAKESESRTAEADAGCGERLTAIQTVHLCVLPIQPNVIYGTTSGTLTVVSFHAHSASGGTTSQGLAFPVACLCPVAQQCGMVAAFPSS